MNNPIVNVAMLAVCAWWVLWTVGVAVLKWPFNPELVMGGSIGILVAGCLAVMFKDSR